MSSWNLETESASPQRGLSASTSACGFARVGGPRPPRSRPAARARTRAAGADAAARVGHLLGADAHVHLEHEPGRLGVAVLADGVDLDRPLLAHAEARQRAELVLAREVEPGGLLLDRAGDRQ